VVANAFLRLLKKADAELLGTWLTAKGLAHSGVPAENAARTEFAAKLYFDAADTGSEAHFDAVTEAGRICAMAEGRFDWVFARQARDLDGLPSHELTGLDRSLWTALYHSEAFEQVERRISYNHFSNTPKKHTRFSTKSQIEPGFDTQAIAAFEAAVKDIYRSHDFSGRHAATQPEHVRDAQGKPVYLVTVTLSQTPKAVARFDENGEARDDALLLATTLHASYEAETGEMYVTASRGGFPVREKVADAFSRLVLGVDEKPAILKSEQLDLRSLITPSELAPIDGVPLDGIDLIEVSLTHPSHEGTSMNFRNADGLPSDFLTSLFGDKALLVDLKSVSLRLHFDADISGKSALPEQMTVTFNKDGSTSLRGGEPIEQLLRDHAPLLWKLKSGSVEG
jgi:hypothetical protein